MSRLAPRPSPSGFAFRKLRELLPIRPRRDWDKRFVTATLLFYALVGAAFFLVGWLNPEDDPPAAGPVTSQEEAGARQPYAVRPPLPQRNRTATDELPESR